MTAAAPRSMFAQAKILLIRHKIMKTMWAVRPLQKLDSINRAVVNNVPYRIRTTSSEVCASGILRLQEIPSNAKNTIIGLQPAANQKGPATP